MKRTLLNDMQVTDLLSRAHRGDSEALASVIPLVYDELKVLAASQLRRERGPVTVQPTALLHEAFLRIAGARLPDCENRVHFYGIAARIMRQVLVDMARSRRSAKRDRRLECPLAESLATAAPDDMRFLAINDALDRLTSQSPLKGRLVELRFFAGLTAEESAPVVSLPVHSVRRELRLALAWLHQQLAQRPTSIEDQSPATVC